MAIFEVEHNGKVYEVEADNADQAAAAFDDPGQSQQSDAMKQGLNELSALTTKPKIDPAVQMAAQPGWKKGAATLWDSMNLIGQGYTHGFGDKIAGTIRAPFTDKTIAEEIAGMRKQTQASRDRQGLMGTGLEVAGAVMGPGMKGNAIKQGGLFGLIDAYGNSDSWFPTTTEEVKDLAKGGAYGVGAGALGQGLAEIVGKTGKKVGSALSNYWASVPDKAKQRIWNLAEKVGWDEVEARFNKHGPDAIAADVLDEEGRTLARTASNYSPAAKETLTDVVEARAKGTTQRAADKLAEAAGIPTGTTVESLRSGIADKFRPHVNAAYKAAKEQGADLPYNVFEDIIASPAGRQAYEQAGSTLQNLAAAEGGVRSAANSELARLDMTVQKLREVANAAFEKGGRQASDGVAAQKLADSLTKRIEESTAGPAWKVARALRRTQGDIDRSLKLGSDLARPTVPLNLPGQVAGATSPKAVAQAYAAEMQERLLNKTNPGAGGLGPLKSPMAKQSMQAALGPRASIVDDALATEKLFDKTNKAITGNSTTAAQQIAAGAVGAGGAALTDDEFSITNPLTWGQAALGGLGLGAATRYGGGAYRKILGGKFAKQAPYIADELVKNYISRNRPIPQNILEKIGPKQREAIMKAIMMGMNQANTAQTRQQER